MAFENSELYTMLQVSNIHKEFYILKDLKRFLRMLSQRSISFQVCASDSHIVRTLNAVLYNILKYKHRQRQEARVFIKKVENFMI